MTDEYFMGNLLTMTKQWGTSESPLTSREQEGKRALLPFFPQSWMAFSFIQMLEGIGWYAPSSPTRDLSREKLRGQFEADVPALAALPDNAEIWALAPFSGITREEADALARSRLPGYMFAQGFDCLYPDDAHTMPITLCQNPVLTVVVIARTRGRYYRSDQPPDYRLDHFLDTTVLCCDARLFSTSEEAHGEAAP